MAVCTLVPTEGGREERRGRREESKRICVVMV